MPDKFKVKLRLSSVGKILHFENPKKGKYWEVCVLKNDVTTGRYMGRYKLKVRSADIGEGYLKKFKTVDWSIQLRELEYYLSLEIKFKCSVGYVFVKEYPFELKDDIALETTPTQTQEMDVLGFVKAIGKRVIKLNSNITRPWTIR